jgi:hypothetical protein
MTDELQEGAQPVNETEELVAPEVLETDAEVQQPSVTEAGITEDRLLEILAERDEKIARQAQSAKDRAISRNAKDIADILERFEAFGGDAAAFVADADRQAEIERQAQWQQSIESKLAAVSAPTKQAWQDEWAGESQKILDAAETDGISLSVEEYNAAMFNNGVAFASKGDAYAALNAALVKKAKGEKISVSAVSTEGGEVARIPEPEAPKEFRQQLNQAIEAGDDNSARAILDQKWEEIERERAKIAARAALDAAGISPEDLTE